jgi:hypothetical protein
MIVLPVPAEPAVRNSHLQRLFQTKRHQGFGGNVHTFAPRQDLSAGSCRRANSSTDRCALSASGNCAYDCADRCPAANVPTCTFVGSDTVRLRLYNTVLGLNPVSLAVDRNGIQIQRDLVVREVLY